MSQALSCRMLAPVAMLLDTPTCAHKLELSLRVGIACDKGVCGRPGFCKCFFSLFGRIS
jgi:hypothetical protein